MQPAAPPVMQPVGILLPPIVIPAPQQSAPPTLLNVPVITPRLPFFTIAAADTILAIPNVSSIIVPHAIVLSGTPLHKTIAALPTRLLQLDDVTVDVIGGDTSVAAATATPSHSQREFNCFLSKSGVGGSQWRIRGRCVGEFASVLSQHIAEVRLSVTAAVATDGDESSDVNIGSFLSLFYPLDIPTFAQWYDKLDIEAAPIDKLSVDIAHLMFEQYEAFVQGIKEQYYVQTMERAMTDSPDVQPIRVRLLADSIEFTGRMMQTKEIGNLIVPMIGRLQPLSPAPAMHIDVNANDSTVDHTGEHVRFVIDVSRFDVNAQTICVECSPPPTGAASPFSYENMLKKLAPLQNLATSTAADQAAAASSIAQMLTASDAELQAARSTAPAMPSFTEKLYFDSKAYYVDVVEHESAVFTTCDIAYRFGRIQFNEFISADISLIRHADAHQGEPFTFYQTVGDFTVEWIRQTAPDQVKALVGTGVVTVEGDRLRHRCLGGCHNDTGLNGKINLSTLRYPTNTHPYQLQPHSIIAPEVFDVVHPSWSHRPGPRHQSTANPLRYYLNQYFPHIDWDVVTADINGDSSITYPLQSLSAIVRIEGNYYECKVRREGVVMTVTLDQRAFPEARTPLQQFLFSCRCSDVFQRVPRFIAAHVLISSATITIFDQPTGIIMLASGLTGDNVTDRIVLIDLRAERQNEYFFLKINDEKVFMSSNFPQTIQSTLVADVQPSTVESSYVLLFSPRDPQPIDPIRIIKGARAAWQLSDVMFPYYVRSMPQCNALVSFVQHGRMVITEDAIAAPLKERTSQREQLLPQIRPKQYAAVLHWLFDVATSALLDLVLSYNDTNDIVYGMCRVSRSCNQILSLKPSLWWKKRLVAQFDELVSRWTDDSLMMWAAAFNARLMTASNQPTSFSAVTQDSLWHFAAIHLQCRINRYHTEWMKMSVPQLADIRSPIPLRQCPRRYELPSELLRFLLASPPFTDVPNRLTVEYQVARRTAKNVLAHSNPMRDYLDIGWIAHDMLTVDLVGIYCGPVYCYEDDLTSRKGFAASTLAADEVEDAYSAWAIGKRVREFYHTDCNDLPVVQFQANARPQLWLQATTVNEWCRTRGVDITAKVISAYYQAAATRDDAAMIVLDLTNNQTQRIVTEYLLRTRIDTSAVMGENVRVVTHGHPLVLTAAPYAQGAFTCNTCSLLYQQTASYHCRICNYDMCHLCISVHTESADKPPPPVYCTPRMQARLTYINYTQLGRYKPAATKSHIKYIRSTQLTIH